MRLFSVLLVLFCHSLLIFVLVFTEDELLMADFSSEGLSASQAESEIFQPKYQHQDDAYVIAVELSDWTFPNAQEIVIEQPKIMPKITSEPIIEETENQSETIPEPKAPAQKPAPKKVVTQKPIQSPKSTNNTHTQKGTGSGNRNAAGIGSGKNSTDGPAGFINGNSEQTILRNIQRCYPLISRRRGEQGLAIVRIHVDANGNSTKVEIIQSTQFSRLDKCALDSVKSLKVKSKVTNGQKSTSYFDQPIRFRLN